MSLLSRATARSHASQIARYATTRHHHHTHLQAPSSVLLHAGPWTSSPVHPITGGITASQHGVHQQVRHSSHSPLGAAPVDQRKKVTLANLRSLHRKGEPITVMTAHDFPSALVADQAGMDMILVGDSLAMVALGMEDTSEVLLEEMLLHCRSVARATKAAFTVCTFSFPLPLVRQVTSQG
jgi:3-methyl-2-oxobutanoate hydroxymethyltransferase